ncbi:hypothetical protein K474DRAFT_146108 [Panus rudis PR-1116 ss-1]|nr:hypothetical protein K474DRAFT_146108 [Panus rudis PR-1116 ss-1]
MARKNLSVQVEELRAEAEGAQYLIAQLEAQLAAAQTSAEESAAQAAVAQAEAEEQIAAANANTQVAEEALQAAQEAQQQQQPPPPPGPTASGTNALPIIPQPHGNVNIRAAMGILLADYQMILRSVRGLTIVARLDWTEDYRRQDPDKLSMVFRAAREEHPILKQYQNNWATAAIIRQYMSNKRKHAVKRGYIEKRSYRRRNDHDAPGPAGSSAV